MQLEAQAAAALETSSIAKPGEGITPNGQDGESTHLHDLLAGLQAMRMGDFSVRLPGDRTGISGKIADTFNEIVASNERMAQQLELVGEVVGREGKIRQRVDFGFSSGAWGQAQGVDRECPGPCSTYNKGARSALSFARPTKPRLHCVAVFQAVGGTGQGVDCECLVSRE